MNVLKPHLRTTVETLLERGESQREIERRTGVARKTIRRLARAAKSPTPATGSGEQEVQNPPPWPPGPDGPEAVEPEPAEGSMTPPGTASDNAGQASACEEHREWLSRPSFSGETVVWFRIDFVTGGVEEFRIPAGVEVIAESPKALWARVLDEYGTTSIARLGRAPGGGGSAWASSSLVTAVLPHLSMLSREDEDGERATLVDVPVILDVSGRVVTTLRRPVFESVVLDRYRLR
ncbi:MAG: hypothetical protein RQ751_07370 [Longimicrobiales bacterium]|nr:hypothetical protein [Longimicrobiales bacterium]